MKQFFMTLGVAAMMFAGCTQGKEEGKPAIDLANFDNTVAAGEDFYQYACGGWMANNPLTPEYARYCIFDQLDKENQEKLKALIEELNANVQEPGSVGEKIQIMYALGLDTTKRNAEGAAPVMEQIAAIKAISNMDELSSMIAKMHVESASPFFGFGIGADQKNSTMNLLRFSQGGLSMGDRDYYLLNDESSVKIREAYKEYMNKLFVLAGYSVEDAAAATEKVLALETKIAEVSVDRATRRDVHKNYNKMIVKEFKKNYGFINWDIFFNEVGIKNSTELNASQKPFFEGMTKMMKKVSLEDQKEYLVFKLLNAASNYLSDEFVQANFAFYG
ncbi:MAG: M13 family peptidase, partial [Bacteroidales bacterium]|nr:M13 family peptidase [Bacteroidales bacterium]